MAQTWPRERALVTGSDMACPRVWVVARLNGYGVRKGRKEGGETGRNRGNAGSGMAGRVDTESGQRKTPQGEPYGGAKRGSGQLSAVACEGAKGHQGDEEGGEKQVTQGAKEVAHTAYLSAMSPQQQRR